MYRASKQSSPSIKKVSSREYCDNRVIEPKNSRIESRSREPKDDMRSLTKGLVDSMMKEIRQMLNSSFKQNNHVSVDGNKGDVHSSPSLIEELSTNASSEHEIENVGVPTTLASSCQELVREELCEEIVVTHESVSNVVELEHKVKFKGIELEKEHEHSEEMSEKSSALILSEIASVYCFPKELIFNLFSFFFFCTD